MTDELERARQHQTAKPLRSLSPQERYFYLTSHSAEPIIVLRVRVAKPFSRDQVESAWTQLSARHESLRVCFGLLDAGRPCWFTTTSPPALFYSDEETEDPTDWVHRSLLPKPRPPVELHISTGHDEGGSAWTDFAAVGSHVLFDGRSMVFLLEDLLSLLTAPAASVLGSRPDIATSRAVSELPRRLPFLTTARMLPAFFWSEVRRKALPVSRAPAPVAQRRQVSHLLALSVGETRALASACRAAGSTVHCVVSAAVEEAFLRVFEGLSGRMICFHAVDMRPKRPSLGRAIGGHSSSVRMVRPIKYRRARPLLERAREVQTALTNSGSTRQMVFFEQMLGFQGRHARSTARMSESGGGRVFTILFTNLGRVFENAPEQVPVVHADLLPSFNAIGGVLTVSVATAGGTLRAWFSMVSPLNTHEQAAALAEETHRALSAFSEGAEHILP